MKMVISVHFKCITSNICTFTHSIWVRERQRVVGRREQCVFCILTPESSEQIYGVCAMIIFVLKMKKLRLRAVN